MSFGARLQQALDARGRLCVGIDPHPSLVQAWGLDPDVHGLERFARDAVAAVASEVAVVKPQSAFFERFGAAGIAALERVLADSREAGALVLLDVKRGDIGSTSQAYADAYLDPAAPLGADAVTASPYLGLGSLEPLLAAAEQHGTGVFVLALTSNPEGAQVQHARDADGRSVAATVLDGLAARNQGARPWGSLGAVVGATVGDAVRATGSSLAINGPLLAPGVGAQGADAAAVRQVFGDAAGAVLPSVSREVLVQGPEPGALRAVVARLQQTYAGLGAV